jgi:tetratricopeptide (TPR) repeat protein
MNRLLLRVLLIVILGFGSSAFAAGRHGGGEGKAPLFSDLGDLNHPVSTKSELAQRYFDQGLTFSFGFNHAEAVRSFKEAARLDPDCAMAYWGVALCLGPNINMPMDASAAPEAWEYLQKALAKKDKANKKEQAYIDALAKRYAEKAPVVRAPLDQAYADAMRDLHKAYPDDLDAAALFAEAMMDLRPWDYWTKEGIPQPGTEEIVATIERILAKDPRHFGACHFYIHAVEQSPEPGKALAAADRLLTLVPAAGHLVHMPAHTYMRVGRYHDASRANELGDKADTSYSTQCRAQGVYPLLYHPHNTHFLSASAAMEGRSKDAIEAAKKTKVLVMEGPIDQPGMEGLQHFASMPLYLYVRFGKWNEIMAEPSPPSDRPYMVGVWRYARAVACARMGHPEDAGRELAALAEWSTKHDFSKLMVSPANPAQKILAIALEVASAETKAASGDKNAAIEHYRKAVELEDDMRYNEPADWITPTRFGLGALLLETGKPAEAEAVYRKELEHNPNNAWSLFGLTAALKSLGKQDEAAKTETAFNQEWKYADIALTSTRVQ